MPAKERLPGSAIHILRPPTLWICSSSYSSVSSVTHWNVEHTSAREFVELADSLGVDRSLLEKDNLFGQECNHVPRLKSGEFVIPRGSDYLKLFVGISSVAPYIEQMGLSSKISRPPLPERILATPPHLALKVSPTRYIFLSMTTPATPWDSVQSVIYTTKNGLLEDSESGFASVREYTDVKRSGKRGTAITMNIHHSQGVVWDPDKKTPAWFTMRSPEGPRPEIECYHFIDGVNRRADENSPSFLRYALPRTWDKRGGLESARLKKAVYTDRNGDIRDTEVFNSK